VAVGVVAVEASEATEVVVEASVAVGVVAADSVATVEVAVAVLVVEEAAAGASEEVLPLASSLLTKAPCRLIRARKLLSEPEARGWLKN